jgi:hypothetical protein
MPTPDASDITRQKRLTIPTSLVRDTNKKVYTYQYQQIPRTSTLANFLSSVSKIPSGVTMVIINIQDIATDDGYGTYVLNANTTIQSNEILNVDVNLFVPQTRTLTVNGTYNLTYTEDILDRGPIIINGTFIVNDGTRYYNERSTVRNNGTLRIIGGEFVAERAFENKNTITIISGGRLRISTSNGSLTNDGTINIGNGVGESKLKAEDGTDVTNNGTINVGNGVSEDYILIDPGVSFTNNGTINVANNSYLDGNSNNVGNPSVVVENGTVNLNGNATTFNW